MAYNVALAKQEESKQERTWPDSRHTLRHGSNVFNPSAKQPASKASPDTLTVHSNSKEVFQERGGEGSEEGVEAGQGYPHGILEIIEGQSQFFDARNAKEACAASQC